MGRQKELVDEALMTDDLLEAMGEGKKVKPPGEFSSHTFNSRTSFDLPEAIIKRAKERVLKGRG